MAKRNRQPTAKPTVVQTETATPTPEATPVKVKITGDGAQGVRIIRSRLQPNVYLLKQKGINRRVVSGYHKLDEAKAICEQNGWAFNVVEREEEAAESTAATAS